MMKIALVALLYAVFVGLASAQDNDSAQAASDSPRNEVIDREPANKIASRGE